MIITIIIIILVHYKLYIVSIIYHYNIIYFPQITLYDTVNEQKDIVDSTLSFSQNTSSLTFFLEISLNLVFLSFDIAKFSLVPASALLSRPSLLYFQLI